MTPGGQSSPSVLRATRGTTDTNILPARRVTAVAPAARRWIGRIIPLVAVAAAMLALESADAAMSRRELAAAWQLIDLEVLGDDPLGSVWHLHTQPPLHNLFVGLVVALPMPINGALMLSYAVTLAITALLLHDLLMRWQVGPVVAGFIAAFSVVQPSLLATIRIASYEVPVAMLLVAVVWSFQRFLEHPSTGWLLTVSTLLTTTALTRSLLHPLWVLSMLVICWLARPVTRRQVLLSLMIPLVLLGGWVLKNQVMFGEPSLSSWQGFNMQRGVVASMERSKVEQAVMEGEVSMLALDYPWQPLEHYKPWSDQCRPDHGHDAVTAPGRRGHPEWINYNHECFVPIFQQAQSDAFTLIRQEPMRYLAMRVPPLVASYQPFEVAADDRATWMDRVFSPMHLRFTTEFGMEDWNLPFLGGPRMIVRVSSLLVGASLFLFARGVLATARLIHARRARHLPECPSYELIWAAAAFTIGWVIVGGDLIEFGENARFRTSVDPLLLGLPLGAFARGVKVRLDLFRLRRNLPVVTERYI